MSKLQSKPETSQKSKLIFIGSLLVIISAFYFLSGLFGKSDAIEVQPPVSASSPDSKKNLYNFSFLYPDEFITIIRECSDYQDFRLNNTDDSFVEYDILDERYEDLGGRLTLSLEDETVCAFTLVFCLPAQPLLSEFSGGILSDLYLREQELYLIGCENILNTFDACANALNQGETVTFASLDNLRYSVEQTMKDGKQREEKSGSCILMASVRDDTDPNSLHISLEITY